ncbi:MAG: hypothetical protein RQ715_05860 [Methylococcales bacterium]|nr:hypothetical protein [Methylococcales bacterium]
MEKKDLSIPFYVNNGSGGVWQRLGTCPGFCLPGGWLYGGVVNRSSFKIPLMSGVFSWAPAVVVLLKDQQLPASMPCFLLSMSFVHGLSISGAVFAFVERTMRRAQR